jgi:hypothetical protein
MFFALSILAVLTRELDYVVRVCQIIWGPPA